MSTAPIFKPEKRTRETWDLQRGLWDLPCGLQALTIAPRVSTLRSGRGWLPGTLLGRVCEFVRDRDGGGLEVSCRSSRVFVCSLVFRSNPPWCVCVDAAGTQ